MRTGIYVSPAVVNARPTARRTYMPRTYTKRFAYRTGGVTAQTETKYFDTGRGSDNTPVEITQLNDSDWSGTEIDPVGLNTLFAPSVGSAYNQREGKKCYLKKLKIKGTVRWSVVNNTTSPPPGKMIRILVYMDKQTNGVQSQGEQVLGDTTNPNPMDMFQNVANFGRFKVLKDKTFTFDAPNYGTDSDSNYDIGGQIRKFKFTKVFRNPLKINFNTGNNGTVADIVDYSFHMIAGATTVVAATPTIEYRVRAVFCE